MQKMDAQNRRLEDFNDEKLENRDDDVPEKNEKVLIIIVLKNDQRIEIKDMDVVKELKCITAMPNLLEGSEPHLIPINDFEPSIVEFAFENMMLFKTALAGPEPVDKAVLKAFEGMDDEQVLDVMKVGDFLVCHPVMDGAAKSIADRLGDCSPDKLQRWFDIECDIPPEEIKRIKRQNNWMNEPRDVMLEWYRKNLRNVFPRRLFEF